jgi:hypothetical protein
MQASQNGHADMVRRLLGKGASMDTQHKQDGSTALMMASQKGHGKVVEMLLGNGASLDLRKKDGWTALMIASHHGRGRVVGSLLGMGASINVQDKDGMTALMAASKNSHEEVVEMLLAKGAKAEIKDKHGQTAIMMGHKKVQMPAGQSSHPELVERQRKADLVAAQLLREEEEVASKEGVEMSKKGRGRRMKSKKSDQAAGEAGAGQAESGYGRPAGVGVEVVEVADGMDDTEHGLFKHRGERMYGEYGDVAQGDDWKAGRECAGSGDEWQVAGARMNKTKDKPPGDDGAKRVTKIEAASWKHDSPAAGTVVNAQGGKASGRDEVVQPGDMESSSTCASSMQEERAASPAAAVAGPPPVAGASEPNAAEGVDECCVCLEADKSHIFAPCGHFCVCQGCADSIMAASKECPVCRQASILCMRVFF